MVSKIQPNPIKIIKLVNGDDIVCSLPAQQLGKHGCRLSNSLNPKLTKIGLRSEFFFCWSGKKNLCWVALKAMSILRTSLQRIIWRWEGGRDRGSTVHCTVQFSRNINSGHCLECHNGSHSENRDKLHNLNLLESQADRIWWEI